MSSPIRSIQEPEQIPALKCFVTLLEQQFRSMAHNRRLAQESFGQRVARLRRARGLTQLEIGERIGLSRRMVAYYEGQSARPPAHVLTDLARALDVSLDELMGLKDPHVRQVPTNLRLWKKLQPVEEFAPADRKAVLDYIQLILAKRKLQQRG